MTKPVSMTDNPHNTDIDLSINSGLDDHVHNNDDLNYATLTEALEQTVFENFDDGLYIGMMSGTSLMVWMRFFVNLATQLVKKAIRSSPCACWPRIAKIFHHGCVRYY